MLEIQTKVKRQIEMLGLALENTTGLKDADFAVLFKRDVPTIKRDMQELRKCGVDVHSQKKRGIYVAGNIQSSVLKEFIAQYLGICTATGETDKATALLVKKLRSKALSHVVTLQRCIDQSVTAFVDYEKESNDVEKQREIGPMLLFSRDGCWRVLAMNDGTPKQYILSKLHGIRPTSRKFKPLPRTEIDDMFRHSFRSWLSKEQYQIRIRLSKEWACRIKPREMMEAQVITEEADGSVIFEWTVNSLNEVAGWVVSRGEGAEVLEPAELRQKVIDLAKGALANYQA